jgi:hypothetical protein
MLMHVILFYKDSNLPSKYDSARTGQVVTRRDTPVNSSINNSVRPHAPRADVNPAFVGDRSKRLRAGRLLLLHLHRALFLGPITFLIMMLPEAENDPRIGPASLQSR